MKNDTSDSNKSFLPASRLAGSDEYDTCTGREPIWSDEEEAAFNALGKTKRAQGDLGELLHLESLRREGVKVPPQETKELRERSISALKSAANLLADNGGENHNGC